MSEHNDPDRYSLDEMMERLKNRVPDPSPEDGELVTRPDGSQAIRIRKRKRRSHQPLKERQLKKRNMQAIQITASLILISLFVLGGGFALVYANSDIFRKNLMKKITVATGAKTKLEQFRMNPRGANAALIELEWPQSEVVKKIQARGLDAKVELQSFLGRDMTGDEVVAQQATVWLGPPGNQPLRKVGTQDVAMLPIHFTRLAASKCMVLYGDPLAPDFSLRDTEVSFFPRVEQSVPRLLANRGELTIKDWPKFQLDRAQLEFVDGMVEVLGFRLRSEKDARGALDFSGRIAPRAVNSSSRLSALAENFPLDEVAGPELGKIFSGRIESDPGATNELMLGNGEVLSSLALSFRCAPNSSLALHGLPFLKILSNVLNDRWFEHPVFIGDVIGVVKREGGMVAITDLDLQSKERMAVKGSIRYGGERAYAGELEIGVSQTVIKASGNRRLDAIFGPPVGNFRWVSLKVSGSAASPADDFEAKYDKAGRGASDEKPAGKVPSFEELTRPE